MKIATELHAGIGIPRPNALLRHAAVVRVRPLPIPPLEMSAMNENFRQFLDRLRQAGELVDLHQAVDIRHIATLVDQAKTGLFFHNVIGYDMPVVSGIIRSRERAVMSMGCENFSEIEFKLADAIAKPIPPKQVKTSPTREVTYVGDDVDLYKLPIPMSSIYDGGPMITAGVVIAKDPELGVNSGIYRFIVKEKSLTGIDIVTPNNMRMFAQRAFERKEPLPISISIGTHPFEIMGSGYRAALGVDEMAIAGGLRGEPVELAPCQTIDVPYIADAEIVLEAEILPTGWTWPEGRFGEFTRLMGGLHWNPLVRIKAISMRKDAIYYNLHMPWENTWLAAPTRYAQIRQAVRTANVAVKDINVTLGGCAFWHAIISIKKAPGDGKNAALAALSVMDLKHVVIVDDDIDVNDPNEVEWAIATRVQADKDVFVIPGARAKPLDPSLLQGAGVVPLGAKVGIDATIPEHIPKEHYERITYAYAETAKVDDYVKGKTDAVGKSGDEKEVAALAAKILAAIDKEPLYYTDIAERFAEYDFRTVARALGHLHETEKLWQDPRGKMCVRGSKFAAVLPATKK
jgi:2,5-furandicarboxylate decarboxylase 1